MKKIVISLILRFIFFTLKSDGILQSGRNYDIVAIAMDTQTRPCYLRVVPTVVLPVLSLIAILNILRLH